MGGTDVLTGCDVSWWQGGALSAPDGMSFALAKATEGAGFKDPAYDRHMSAIRAHPDLVPGAYPFLRPDLGNSPESEAEWFWRVIEAGPGGAQGLLLPADLEVGSGPLLGHRDRFCARLQTLAAGAPVGWYSYSSFIRTHALNAPTSYWGFLAWPDSNGPLPAVNFQVVMQQYGLRSVPGIGGMVDANRFFGSLADLRALTVGGSVAPPEDLALEDVMPLTIERPDGSGEDQFAVMPDGKLHHVFFAADGSDPKWDDDCPGEWAAVGKARWFGGVLVVWAYGWAAGKGGSLWKVWWSPETGTWRGSGANDDAGRTWPSAP